MKTINIKIEYRQYSIIECFVFQELIYKWVVWTLELLFQKTILLEVISYLGQYIEIT